MEQIHMRVSGIAIGVLLLTSQQIMAQDYKVVAHRAGEPSQSEFNSSGGTIDLDHGRASFHTLDFQFKGIDKDKLRFGVDCAYKNGRSAIVVGSCVAPDSQYIRAIRIRLEGSEAEKYWVEYECWVSYFNQLTRTAILSITRV